jgi:hypothetical protein
MKVSVTFDTLPEDFLRRVGDARTSSGETIVSHCRETLSILADLGFSGAGKEAAARPGSGAGKGARGRSGSGAERDLGAGIAAEPRAGIAAGRVARNAAEPRAGIDAGRVARNAAEPGAGIDAEPGVRKDAEPRADTETVTVADSGPEPEAVFAPIQNPDPAQRFEQGQSLSQLMWVAGALPVVGAAFVDVMLVRGCWSSQPR